MWFKQGIPRFSFISWLAMKSRLPTRDPLRNWGLNVQADCVLCSGFVESHDHLFFGCGFSSELWQGFNLGMGNHLPVLLHSFGAAVTSVSAFSRSATGVVAKLLSQAIVYSVWKERNSRIFTGVSSSAASVRAAVDRVMRDRLLSFPATSVSSPSLLEVYFQCVVDV